MNMPRPSDLSPPLFKKRVRAHAQSVIRAFCGVASLFVGSSAISGTGTAAFESLDLPSGRHQLFIDDFVLGNLYRVERVIHPLRKSGSPVIRADIPTDGNAIEMPDGPSWDAHAKVWKVWYWANGDHAGTGYAWSKNGLDWEKPSLGLVERNGDRNNNLITVKGEPTAFIQHVFLDPTASPERRYKAMTGPHSRQPLVSADGFVFTRLNVPSIPSHDTSHLTWDSLQEQYLMTVKLPGPFGRAVFLSLSRDFENWTTPELIYHADAIDQALGAEHIREIQANSRMWRPTINRPSEYKTEIYNMPIFVYQGVYVGLPTYFESSGMIPLPRGNQDGTNSVKLSFSRDLRTWTRVGNRKHFIPVSEMGNGSLDTGQILAASHPIQMGEELWFYYTGIDVRYRPNTPNINDEFHGAIHLGRLRLDGFVSLRAGIEGGIIETRAVKFEGGRIYVNTDAAQGGIEAEIIDGTGRSPRPGWGRGEFIPIVGNHLRAELCWKGHDGVKELAGKVIRIRFYVKNADLFSFWPES